MRPPSRTPRLIGALNGAIVMALVSVAYAAISGWQFHPAQLAVGTPFAAIAAWRGSRFVHLLQQGEARPFRGPLEGFFLAFGATAVWIAFSILTGHIAGGDPQGWGWSFWSLLLAYTSFYSFIAGAGGALVGAILETIDVLIVELRRT